MADLSALREIAGASENDHSLQRGYELSDGQLNAIARVFDRNFQPEGRPVRLVPWSKLRELPYLVHTEFELALMLEGRKPLAAFADAASWLNEYVRPFDRLVASGRLTRRDFDQPEFREVYFTLPGHEWRVDAYRLLSDIGAKTRLEREI